MTMTSPATIYFPDGTQENLDNVAFNTFHHDVFNYLRWPTIDDDVHREFTALSTTTRNNPWHIKINNNTVDHGSVYALCDVRELMNRWEYACNNTQVTYPRLFGVTADYYEVWGPVIWVHRDDPRDAEDYYSENEETESESEHE